MAKGLFANFEDLPMCLLSHFILPPPPKYMSEHL